MKIKTFAPASIGNFIVGFDILGLAVKDEKQPALGDYVTIDDQVDDSTAENILFEARGPFAQQLPERPEDNVVLKAVELFHNTIISQKNIISKPLKITLEKNLPIGSGLGSSACSIVAAMGALNKIYAEPLDSLTLLRLCGELESGISGGLHLDNVAPSLLGGLTLIPSSQNELPTILPIPSHWRFVLCYPGTQLSTKSARLVLPSTISLKKSIAWSQQMSQLVCALQNGANDNYFKSLLIDTMIEPHRAKLIPDFERAKTKALDGGAMAFGISGAGPTMVAICHSNEAAESVATTLEELYHYNRSAFVRVCEADFQGIRSKVTD